MDEQLAREIKNWPVVDLDIPGADHLAYCRPSGNLTTAKRGYERLALDPGPVMSSTHFWGWLPAANLNPAGDRWWLTFQMGNRGGQETLARYGLATGVHATLPAAWDGDLHQILLAHSKPWDSLGWPSRHIYLGGKLDEQEPIRNWLVEGEPAEIPDWPRLENGDFGWRKANTMKLQGVFRRKGMVKRFLFDELAIAWVEPDTDRFIGWEPVRSMAVVHRVLPTSERQYCRLDEWEELEKALRAKSSQREI